MTDTTGRTIRIESALDTDRKTHALHHTKVTVDGVDITNDVIAIDWHADATSAPTATIRMYAPALQAEALEAVADTSPVPLPIAAGATNSQIVRHFEAHLAAVHEQTAEITTQLAELHDLLAKVDDDQISNHLRCLGCLVEQHQGARAEVNAASTIVNGQATCLSHLQFADGPVLPGRTQSGLILGNGA